jgi:hypothetical protein
MVEQGTHKPLVGGSNPLLAIIVSAGVYYAWRFLCVVMRWVF